MKTLLLSMIYLAFSGQALLAATQAPDRRILLSEDFNEIEQYTFSSKAVNDPGIQLARGAGPDGSDAIRVAYVGYERGSQRVVLRYPLEAEVEAATLSFDVYFEEDFPWTLGGKLHGLGPKNPVTGGNQRQADKWSARIMFKQDGKVSTYLYDQDQSKKWGTGQSTRAPVFKSGKWHHVDLQVQLNDPELANGFARILVDGEVVIDTQYVQFRGVGGENTLIQQLLFSTFHGGNQPDWTPRTEEGEPATVYAFFDNFVVYEGIAE